MTIPTALIIDDAPDLRLLMRQLLERQDFKVVEATSGEDALSVLRAFIDLDVAVIDVQMPSMDGWETLTAIRRDPTWSELPVVLCTVKASVDDHLMAWELGADAFVSKPFSIADLVSEVVAVTTRPVAERTALRRARLETARRDAGAGGTFR